MINYQAVSLFEDLNSRYPMAAAGLIHDLCDRLSVLLENENPDEHALGDACETLAQILRPFSELQFHVSYPWDAAYDRFGRWLMRGLPRYRDAIIAITGWSDEQMATCKAHFIEMVRILHDDWNRAAQDLENKNIE